MAGVNGGDWRGEIDIELSRHHLRLTWPARIAANCHSSKARPFEPVEWGQIPPRPAKAIMSLLGGHQGPRKLNALAGKVRPSLEPALPVNPAP